MVWPNSAHKITKKQSICYRPDWTRIGLLLRRTKLILITRQNAEEEEQISLFQYLIEVPISCPSSLVCWRRERRKNNKERGDAQEKERIRRGWVTMTVYRRNLNIQRSKLNYSHVIHPTSESSMWISKRLRFDEIFTSVISDWPSEQRFKKSTFRSTLEPLCNIFFGVTFPPPSPLKRIHPRIRTLLR
jgi:hypothetical protein